MSKKAVLAKFASRSDTELRELETNWYAVVARGSGVQWETAKTLVFQSDKLARIQLTDAVVFDKAATPLAQAIYDAVAAASPSGFAGAWTEKTEDANGPVYRVVLSFKDREVVIDTLAYKSLDSVLVRTYFPSMRLLTSASTR